LLERRLRLVYTLLHSANQIDSSSARTEAIPMPSMYPYWETISNDYLGVSKVIKARTPWDLNWQVEAQLRKWAEQEGKKREQAEKQAQRKLALQAIESLKLQAEDDTKTAQERVKSYKNILVDSLDLILKVDWEKLQDHRSFPQFKFARSKPDMAQIRLE